MITQDAVVAANRFGYGASPDQVETIATDPRGWVKQQIVAERSLPAPLAALPSTFDDQLAFFRWLRDYRKEIAAPDASMSGSVEKSYVKALYPRYATAVKARFDTAVASTTPVFERLVHFWSNHFTVSGVKPIAIALPPSFERDAIRPFVTGKFADMLLAVTKHPAMLIYLDNTQSIGPHSRWARDPPRRSAAAAAFPRPTGLNENLAREILELHTVGVHGGYEQADVTRFANIITGWQVLTPRQLGRFAARWAGIGTDLFYFNADAHEPGDHAVLGKTYRAGGVEQGRSRTARPRATSRHRALHRDEARAPFHRRLAGPRGRGQPRDGVSRYGRRPRGGDARARRHAAGVGAAAHKAEAAGGISDFRCAHARWSAAARATGHREPERDGPAAVHVTGPRRLERSAGHLVVAGRRLEAHRVGATGRTRAGRCDRATGRVCTGGVRRHVVDATRTAIGRAESPAQGLALLLTSPEFMRR